MMRRVAGWWVAVGLAAASAGWAEGAAVDVSGRVVGPDGKPVPGMEVSRTWRHGESGLPRPDEGLTLDAEGRFTASIESYGRPIALMAMNADGTQGGLAVIDPAKAGEPVEIRVGPLARALGEFTSKDPAFPLRMASMDITVGNQGPTVGRVFLPNFDPKRKGLPEPGPLRFDLRLPPGRYVMVCREPMLPSEHMAVARWLDLKPEHADKPLAVGPIALEVNPLALQIGKPAPPLSIKAARGVPAGMKLEDFRGKYVLLEFWATWCGPCVGKGLPDAMRFFDEHEADRDKFVILAVHGQGSDDFADLDRKAVAIVRDVWFGRELPFPIVIDDDGKTFAAYGIEAIPQTILIDPEGKIVKDGLYALGRALPPVPMARKLALALDRQVASAFWADGQTLGVIAKRLAEHAEVPIRVDAGSLAGSGVGVDAAVPLTLQGRLSLRSWLDLALSPLGLAAIPDPDGLVIVAAAQAPKADGPSAPQRRCAERLARKLGEPIAFDFRGATLLEVSAQLQKETGENFVLDVADRKAGRLDADAKVTGRADGVPLRDALMALLGPLGIEASIRDELYILGKAPSP